MCEFVDTRDSETPGVGLRRWLPSLLMTLLLSEGVLDGENGEETTRSKAFSRHSDGSSEVELPTIAMI